METPCQCQGAGYCPVFRQELNQRFFEFCKGISGLSREKEIKYLQLLAGDTEPDFFDKLTNLAEAMKAHVQSGFAHVSEEVYSKRLQTCAGCMHHKDNTCNLCGCTLTTKARWASQECPLGKWEGAKDNKPLTPSDQQGD